MLSSLTLEKNGAWRLRLMAETPAEQCMVSTLEIPWKASHRNAQAFLEASPGQMDGKHDTVVVEVKQDDPRVTERT